MGSGQFLDQVLENDEFGKLDQAFHEMVLRIERYVKDSVREEVERKLLQAELLQVHINPHVLYNTLSAIKWKYEDENLHRLIDDMVDFYRLFLNKGETETSLFQEFELINKYVNMHKFSYATDFTFDMQLDEQIGHFKILRNLLQPIVENSLIHGIALMSEGAKVCVTAKRDREHIRITIQDNGAGMSRTVPIDNRKPDGSGYALTNIQRRIKLYYGDEFGLMLNSGPGCGTTVEMLLPADGARLNGRNREEKKAPDAV